jgi:hypothetical protein
MSRFRLSGVFVGLALLLGAVSWARAQQQPTGEGVPAHLVVTVEPHKGGGSMPEVNSNEVMVYEGKDRDQVLEWVPAQGDHAALELFLLLDDSSSINLGSQLDELRKFIDSQPPTTKIGVAYMQNGTARIEQNLTDDHAQAAKALRLPMGIAGANASPYFSLSDLAKRWPSNAPVRRSVFMVSDGIDRYYGVGDLQDPYLQEAIDDALRANITVSAVYNPDVGHFGHSYWLAYWGQMYLSEAADETGGEAYYIGFSGPAVSFGPYLEDLQNRLSHQYLLTFLAKRPKKSGWQRVRLRTELHNIDLISAKRVWVSP